MKKQQDLKGFGPFKKVQEQVLTFTELQTLVKTPSNPNLPLRHDKLLECVLLMGYLGLRVSEAINFTPFDSKSP
jgi:hypothetical protein